MIRRMSEMRSDLGVLLTAASKSFWERLCEHLQQAGCREIRPNQDYVLRALACDTMTITALARQFGISKQAAVSLVDDLEQSGYAYREQSVSDRRIKVIHLTPAAQQIVEATNTAGREVAMELAQEVGDEAIETACRVLAAIVEQRGGMIEAMSRRHHLRER